MHPPVSSPGGFLGNPDPSGCTCFPLLPRSRSVLPEPEATRASNRYSRGAVPLACIGSRRENCNAANCSCRILPVGRMRCIHRRGCHPRRVDPRKNGSKQESQGSRYGCIALLRRQDHPELHRSSSKEVHHIPPPRLLQPARFHSWKAGDCIPGYQRRSWRYRQGFLEPLDPRASRRYVHLDLAHRRLHRYHCASRHHIAGKGYTRR